jgi:hypothetical protein
MKRKRFSVEQTVAVVKQHELGTPVADIARKLESPSRLSIGRSSTVGSNPTKSVSSSSCATRTRS